LTAGQLGKVAQINRSVCEGVKSFERRAYPINRFLGNYFQDPIAFCRLQAKTGTLISGPFALAFMGRTAWEVNNLDLYICPDFLPVIFDFLMNDGYFRRFLHAPSSRSNPSGPYPVGPEVVNMEDNDAVHQFGDPFLNLYIKGLVIFEKRNGSIISNVQVIISNTTPLAVILKFHSNMSLYLSLIIIVY